MMFKLSKVIPALSFALTIALFTIPVYLMAEEKATVTQADLSQTATELSAQAGSAEGETDPTSDNESSPRDETIAKPTTPTVTQADRAEELRQPDGSLRDRTLRGAFEKFIPSESISADNAVPFPIDI